MERVKAIEVIEEIIDTMCYGCEDCTHAYIRPCPDCNIRINALKIALDALANV